MMTVFRSHDPVFRSLLERVKVILPDTVVMGVVDWYEETELTKGAEERERYEQCTT